MFKFVDFLVLNNNFKNRPKKASTREFEEYEVTISDQKIFNIGSLIPAIVGNKCIGVVRVSKFTVTEHNTRVAFVLIRDLPEEGLYAYYKLYTGSVANTAAAAADEYDTDMELRGVIERDDDDDEPWWR